MPTVKAVYRWATQVWPKILYNKNISAATQDQSRQPTSISNQRCIDVSSDGYHILLTNENWPVTEHTLSTAYDISSTISTKTATLAQYGYTNCVVYSDDWRYIYIENWDSSHRVINQRQLSTPFDISTAWNILYTKDIYSFGGIGGFRFYDNWTKIIWVKRDQYIFTWTLWTAWRINTLTNLTTQTTQQQYWGYWNWFAISQDGKTCYMVSEYESNIAQVDSTTAYNFSSATKTTRSLSGTKFWITIADGWHYCFVALQNWTIYRYTFPLASSSSSGWSSVGCFLEWTPILMKEWYKNIENIIEWDEVLSFNEEREEIECNKVINFIKHPYDGKIVKLKTDKWTIEATYTHLVYTSKDKENREYKIIWDINIWDWLYSKDWYREVISKEERDYEWDVYNLTVDDNHNYFVYDWILVHNMVTGQ